MFNNKGMNCTREELRKLLGEPTDVSTTTRKYYLPMIWKYGEIEYHLDGIRNEDKVFLIYQETDGWIGSIKRRDSFPE